MVDKEYTNLAVAVISKATSEYFAQINIDNYRGLFQRLKKIPKLWFEASEINVEWYLDKVKKGTKAKLKIKDLAL